ncbi:hypothetical protein GLW36_11635 [Halorubrum terrestre]|uniref:Uncharacterized protein n=1 Tax=Halorubrum distributum TaxID=29283 RepID=A0A6B1IDJ0_9EURY|nr:hypothetical protein [Halorubrum terrestre]MYL17289.1 hypothetical protein [Halorubrum terrestre]
MVSTTAVKRALAALATRTDTARRPYAAVIDEADAARADLRRAAGFVDAVGLDRLADAVDAAERAGDEATAERGRDALAAYRGFRRAAAVKEGGNCDSDHFRSGPGIPKPDTGQDANR